MNCPIFIVKSVIRHPEARVHELSTYSEVILMDNDIALLNFNIEKTKQAYRKVNYIT